MVVITRRQKADSAISNRSAKKKKSNKSTKRLLESFNHSRRVTRSLAKKMSSHDNQKYYPLSRHAKRKNRRPQKLSQKMMKRSMENDKILASCNCACSRHSIERIQTEVSAPKLSETKIEPNISSQIDVKVPSETVPKLITDLTDEDRRILDEVLDLMEDHGLLLPEEREDVFKNIQTDLNTACDELEATIGFLTEEFLENKL